MTSELKALFFGLVLLTVFMTSPVGAVILDTPEDTLRFDCDDQSLIQFVFNNRSSGNVSLYKQNLTNIPIVETERFNETNLTLTERVRYYFLPNVEVDSPVLLWSGDSDTVTLTFRDVGLYTFWANDSYVSKSNEITVRVKNKTPLGIAKCGIEYYLTLLFAFTLTLFLLKVIILKSFGQNNPPPMGGGGIG